MNSNAALRLNPFDLLSFYEHHRYLLSHLCLKQWCLFGNSSSVLLHIKLAWILIDTIFRFCFQPLAFIASGYNYCHRLPAGLFLGSPSFSLIVQCCLVKLLLLKHKSNYFLHQKSPWLPWSVRNGSTP